MMSGHRCTIQSEVGMSEVRCECGWHTCVEIPDPKTIEEIDALVAQHRYEAAANWRRPNKGE
jgi:hypothetical protein